MRARLDQRLAAFLFEHARDIVLVIDADDGRVIDANAAAEQAYGYTRAELLARTIYDLRGVERQVVVAQMKLADSEGILFESFHQRRDGRRFPVEVSSRGETLGDRRLLLSVIRDISARKQLEAEREALMQTTQRALALRDEFLVVASHELRSPVTNISLQLQQLQRLVDREMPAHPAVSAAACAALGEITRLSALIDTLLDAQVVAGEIVLARGPVELADLVREVVARLRARAELAGAEVRVAVPDVRGHWDRMRLDQVLTNLVLNALKYGLGKPVDVTGTVAKHAVELEVRDHGIGLEPADVPRIFDKYERAVPPAYGGLGLGLYLSRKLVEAHGGTLRVESRPGEGTAFRITLPLG